MPDWNALFALTVPALEIFLRGTLTFLALMAMVRLAGQRETGGLGLTDIFLVVLVAQAVQPGMVSGASSLLDGALLAATVFFWSLVLDAVAYRWPALARVIKSQPRLLIDDGRFHHKALRRELMTEDELMVQLRLHGARDPSEVKRAYLEPNGVISVVRRDDGEVDEPPRPPTA